MINKEEIKEFIVSKFQNLFTEEPIFFPVNLDNLISPSISLLENESLCQIPSHDEIKRTIIEMNNLKAPGPGGLLVIFYKRY